MTLTAAPITSAGRFSPRCPRGISSKAPQWSFRGQRTHFQIAPVIP
jgi:hypothetical protein